MDSNPHCPVFETVASAVGVQGGCVSEVVLVSKVEICLKNLRDALEAALEEFSTGVPRNRVFSPPGF